MALKGLSLAETRTITSKFDTGGDDDKTKFQIGTLDSRLAALLRDKGTTVTVNPSALDDEVDSQINMNLVHFEACVYGLRGWSNFKDDDGNDIKFTTLKRNHGGVSYVVASPANVALIPNAVIQELGAEILKENEMTADEVKN